MPGIENPAGVGASTGDSPGVQDLQHASTNRSGSAPSAGAKRNPLPLAGAAFAAGVVLAKLIDWRGHAHPRA